MCNAALNRPSNQSSVFHSFGPHLGNDGRWKNLVTSVADPRCAHTVYETNPWWAVDLGVPLSVREIFFTNRLEVRTGEFGLLFKKSVIPKPRGYM